MHNGSKVIFLIAAYNEDKVIEETCAQIKLSAPKASILVVDDGSNDKTFEIVSALKEIIALRHPINLGQGAALQTGFEYAKRHGYDYAITFDADGQHRVEDALAMLQLAQEEKLDCVLGSRFLEAHTHSEVPQKKRLVLQLAVAFTRITTGLKLTDTHNGLRVLGQKALKKIHLYQNGMSHASEILEQIAKENLSYKEHPTKIRYTEYSMAKGQKLSNSINILWDLFTKRMKF